MKLKFHTRDLDSSIKKITDEITGTNSYWVLSLQKRREKRSLNQNDYYFGVVVKIFSDFTGYDKHESHQFLAARFLSYQKNGNLFIKSTSQLNTKEFEEYLEQCRVFMWHELGTHVPLPNEVPEELINDNLNF